MTELRLDPDRALPGEPATRAVARTIYTATRAAPLLCLHGHVDAALLAQDTPFPDPAALLVTPDHYLTRMIASAGVPLGALGVAGPGEPAPQRDPREIWRTFCAHWRLFRGTPTRFWLEHELAEVFGVSLVPGPDTADLLYDQLTERLRQAQFRPRALFERFGIELLATTDSALSPLSDHALLRAHGWGERVIPTLRPDELVAIDQPGWPAALRQLAELTGEDATTYQGFLAALRQRRAAFAAAGARATDHGHRTASTTRLTSSAAEAHFVRGLRGEASEADAEVFAGHMLHVMAEMSTEDGLVMQLHPGVLRDHDPGVRARYGPDRGFDIPVAAEFTRGLRPLLTDFGHHPSFRLVLYTVDETVYSRELAPLAGAYPAVRLGAPWWFLDSPDGMRRFRELVTETAGFYNTAGFVDDTRAFASIPARHDLARRIDAGYLARLVIEHRLTLDEAVETGLDLAYHLPRETFRAGEPGYATIR